LHCAESLGCASVRGHRDTRLKMNRALGIHETRRHLSATDVHTERKCVSCVHVGDLKADSSLRSE